MAERVVLVRENEDGAVMACATAFSIDAHRQGDTHGTALFWLVADTPSGPGIVWHLRSPFKLSSPVCIDAGGGHLSASAGDVNAIEEGSFDIEKAYDDAAIRELNEEVRLEPAYRFNRTDLRRFSDIGAFECHDPGNREMSTLYIAHAPAGHEIQIWDSDTRGERQLPSFTLSVSAALDLYRRHPSVFADGAARVLGAISSNRQLRIQLERAVAIRGK